MPPLRDDELGKNARDVAYLTDLFVGERLIVQEFPGVFETQHDGERTPAVTRRC